MTAEMQIKLSTSEQQIVSDQCQQCQLWDEKVGCTFYPITPEFADNRPMPECIQFGENKK